MNFKDRVIAEVQEKIKRERFLAGEYRKKRDLYHAKSDIHDEMAGELENMIDNIKAMSEDKVKAEHPIAPRPAIFGEVKVPEHFVKPGDVLVANMDDSMPQNGFRPWTNEGANTIVGPGAILTKAEVDEIQEVMNVNKVPLSDLIMTAEDLKNYRGQSKADDHPLDSHPV